MSFDVFNFTGQLAANIKALGFDTPTPIQAQAIPPIREKKDLIGLAQTGTGKTAAFVLPALERFSTGPRKHVRGLIIAPTRELAQQITGVIADLGKHMNIRSTAIYGGAAMGPQINTLRHGVEIIVACPGRLLDHVNRRSVDISHVEYLVLDEADRLFDMGFLPDIRRILSRLPRTRQTLLFSATMPEEVRALTHDILQNPVTVQIALAVPLASVTHAIYPVQQHLKTSLLLALLEKIDRESVLVFTRTKRRAERVGKQLVEAGHKAACLQGNLSQYRRKAAMDGFREGRYHVLVATDIAARGIDVSTISHVINYDIPDTVDAYTHRIGRTGRAAKTGDAFTFVSPEDNGMVRCIERVLKQRLASIKLEGFDYLKNPPPKPAAKPHSPSGQRPQGERQHFHQERRPEGERRQFSQGQRHPAGERKHSPYEQRPQGERHHASATGHRAPQGQQASTAHHTSATGHRTHQGQQASTGHHASATGHRTHQGQQASSGHHAPQRQQAAQGQQPGAKPSSHGQHTAENRPARHPFSRFQNRSARRHPGNGQGQGASGQKHSPGHSSA